MLLDNYWPRAYVECFDDLSTAKPSYADKRYVADLAFDSSIDMHRRNLCFGFWGRLKFSGGTA